MLLQITCLSVRLKDINDAGLTGGFGSGTAFQFLKLPLILNNRFRFKKHGEKFFLKIFTDENREILQWRLSGRS